MLTQAFFNERLIPSFLALVAEPRVKLEVAYISFLTQFLKSVTHIKCDSFFLFGKWHIQYEGESFTELFFLGGIQLTQIFPKYMCYQVNKNKDASASSECDVGAILLDI